MDTPGQFLEPATTSVKCRCGSRNIDLIESGTWSSAFIVTDGRLDRAEGFHEPESVDRLDAFCRVCRRRWHPRRADGRGAHQIDDVVTLDKDLPQ